MDIEGIEHELITDENRGAFATHMEKFDSMEAAALDGMGLKQMQGKPFKFPESMDKLPDDTSRAEFISKAHKLLGVTHADSIDDLGDLDLKLGSTSDAMDDKLAAAFKEFVVSDKIDKATAQKMIGFHNKAMGLSREAFTAAKKAAEDQAAAKLISDKRACNDVLVAHADFATQEALDKQNILLHRALKDNAGISVEEADEMSEFLNDREGATNPVLRRLLLKAYAPMAAESSTEGGDGKGITGKPAMSEAEQKKEAEVKKVLRWK